MTKSVILDVVKRADDEAAERKMQAELVEADRERSAQRRAEALLPQARAILGRIGEEADVVVETAGATYGTFRVTPHVWHGLVSFRLSKVQDESFWRFQPWHGGGFHRVQTAADWTGELATQLMSLHEAFEKKRDERIKNALALLARTDTADDEAMRCRLDLLDLAPERGTEWEAAFAEWVRRRDAEAEAAAQREGQFLMYLAALAAWREGYEATLRDNRAAAERIQADANERFTRYEVAYASAADGEYDDEEPYLARAWAYDDKPDKRGYWTLYESGRLVRRRLMRAAWVGEGVAQTVIDAGHGPWRAAVYVEEADKVIYCLPWYVDVVTERVRAEMTALPEEPRITDWGDEFAGGWTADEHRRYAETVGDMRRAAVPF